MPAMGDGGGLGFDPQRSWGETQRHQMGITGRHNKQKAPEVCRGLLFHESAEGLSSLCAVSREVGAPPTGPIMRSLHGGGRAIAPAGAQNCVPLFPRGPFGSSFPRRGFELAALIAPPGAR